MFVLASKSFLAAQRQRVEEWSKELRKRGILCGVGINASIFVTVVARV
jgi:hypothetical protein